MLYKGVGGSGEAQRGGGYHHLAGYGPWGRKQSDMAEQLHFPFFQLRQQGPLPPTSAETEPHAAVAGDLRHPLRKVRVETEAPCAPGNLEQVF